MASIEHRPVLELDGYFRAVNFFTVGQIYLPKTSSDLKPLIRSAPAFQLVTLPTESSM